MMIDTEEPRHHPAAVARQLEHGQRLAGRAAHPERLVADAQRSGGQRPGLFDEVVKPVVEDAQPPVAAAVTVAVAGKAPEPGMGGGLGGQHVFERPRALAPLFGTRSRGRAMPVQRQITPKLWQTANSAAPGSARTAWYRRK